MKFKNTKRTPWEDWEINYIKSVSDDENVTYQEICEKINRSLNVVKYKYKKIGLIKKIKKRDYTNLIQGYLKVVKYSHSDDKNTYWECYCNNCGSTTIKQGSIFSKQTTRNKQISCGCLKNPDGKNAYWWDGYEEISKDFYNSIVKTSKIKNLDFDIDIKFLWELFIKQDRKCAISGRDLVFAKKYKNRVFQTASVDRIDSSKGYTKDNVQWVHKEINFLKSNRKVDELVSMCKEISNHCHYKNKNIIVWGACGYIGSHLVGNLLNKGYNVIAYDNLFKSGISINQYFNHPNFKFKKLDISNEECVIESFKVDKIDGIILLSGIVGLGDCKKHFHETIYSNDIGWYYLSKYYNKNIPLISAGSGSVFGIVEGKVCNEDTPTNPQSHYAITKLNGEKHIIKAGGKSFRFATAAGVSPSPRWNLLPNELCYLALNKGYLDIFEPNNMRTFIDIRDFTDSLIFGVENFNNLEHDIYCVGDELNNWSKKQLALYIKDLTGCKISYNENTKDPDARNYYCDYTRINKAGFKCSHMLSNTLERLIESCKILEFDKAYYGEEKHNREHTLNKHSLEFSKSFNESIIEDEKIKEIENFYLQEDYIKKYQY